MVENTKTIFGNIPDDWTADTIDSCFAIVSGSGFPVELQGNKYGDYPVAKASDIAKAKGRLNSACNYIDEDIRLQTSLRVIPAGSTLMPKIGEALRTNNRAFAVVDCCVDNNCQGAVPKDIVPEWGFYIFTNIDMNDFDNNGSIPSVNVQKLKDAVIPVPPLPEQERIASILGDLDDLIEKQAKIIDKKKRFRDGMREQIFTQALRVVDDGSHWEEKPLDQLAQIVMGHSPQSQFYNTSCKGAPLVQGNADIVDRATKPRQYTSFITNTADKGDIILTVRAPVGSVAICSGYCCIGRGVCALKNAPEYLYHWLVYKEDKWSGNEGSIFDSITGDRLKETTVPLPSSETEQQAISQILSNADNEIAALELELEKNKVLKSGLLHQLITGEIRA